MSIPHHVGERVGETVIPALNEPTRILLGTESSPSCTTLQHESID